ncbi:LPXTG cell wall anchor domain-containing protein [Clostridium swellfunianum]|uniref:LPXTG cell wall anchor domain-containing protein n=1 Tax=Clostridium swellfunianum TaxID=1367462 RepID=UPI002030A282|nr:LPXTG cell wall anchor domain-containing protein [Clostridium swellfunianum]
MELLMGKLMLLVANEVSGTVGIFSLDYKIENPKTGDNSNIGLQVFLMLASAGALVFGSKKLGVNNK